METKLFVLMKEFKSIRRLVEARCSFCPNRCNVSIHTCIHLLIYKSETWILL
ncbi:hypothetical protein I3760_15G106400 [Carya illinoinensis]|nr:hypothetical protein I3760_15G106400 [Carya illinoinensis]